MYTKSVADLHVVCTQYQIPLKTFYLFNESLITRARNYCVDEFMRSDSTHLLFIDSDIGFNPNDVLALLALSDESQQYPVIGAPYPKKTISWEKIVQAVNKGVADDDPNELDKYVGDFVFNPVGKPGEDKIEIRLDIPAEVLEIGTGFMLIQRSVFEKWNEKYPQYLYRPDHVRTEHFDGSREIMMYFQAEIDPVSKRYLSEDYWFCQQTRALGLKIYICPWMSLQHIGTYIFGGSMAAMAQVGVHPTADGGILHANREKKKKNDKGTK